MKDGQILKHLGSGVRMCIERNTVQLILVLKDLLRRQSFLLSINQEWWVWVMLAMLLMVGMGYVWLCLVVYLLNTAILDAKQ